MNADKTLTVILLDYEGNEIEDISTRMAQVGLKVITVGNYDLIINESALLFEEYQL